jgi:hypothetical protein
VWGGHGGELVEGEGLPIWFGGGFAEVEADFVAGDRVKGERGQLRRYFLIDISIKNNRVLFQNSYFCDVANF